MGTGRPLLNCELRKTVKLTRNDAEIWRLEPCVTSGCPAPPERINDPEIPLRRQKVSLFFRSPPLPRSRAPRWGRSAETDVSTRRPSPRADRRFPFRRGRVEIDIMHTPGGGGWLEFSHFLTSPTVADHRTPSTGTSANTGLCYSSRNATHGSIRDARHAGP
jgi:hypothetical protein